MTHRTPSGPEAALPLRALEGGGSDTDGAKGMDARSGLTRRRRWAVGVVVGAVLLAGAGIAAASVVKSPAQVAAEAGPPPRDVLTAPVEQRVLKETVVLRGTVTAGQSVQVPPPAVGDSTPVVTRLPLAQGARIRAGQVVAEVSGRPVFALPGTVPSYRDLRPDTEGKDVAQLQKALRGLGHGTGADADGTFGPGTKAALAAFYASIGYEPRPAVDDGGEAVRSARQAVTAADRAVEDARYAVDQARARAGAVGTGGSGSTDATSGAEDTGGAAGTEDTGGKAGGAADAGGPGAGAPVSGADLHALDEALARAEEDRDAARTALAEARAAAGPMLPSGEVVYLSSFPARVDAVPVKLGSRVDGPVMTLSSGALVAQGYVPEYQKGLVRAGQKVRILSEGSGTTAAATVESVANRPTTATAAAGGQDGSTGDDGGDREAAAGGSLGYLITIRPDRALPAALSGADIRLTIEAAATSGKALVVPVTAVSAGADSRTVVTTVDGKGRQTRVEVRTGTTGDGYVEVVPVVPGSLHKGDDVVTGINAGAAKAGS